MTKNQTPDYVKTYLETTLEPAFENNNVAIVLASDDIYAKYLGITITSVIANSSPLNNYDFIIFDGGISKYNAYLLMSLAHGKSNVSIRFFDVMDYTKKWKDLFYERNNLTIAMYYRLFIPSICCKFQRVLYMDCDTIADADIAELFNTDMEEKAVAAVIDMVDGFENASLSRYLQEKLPELKAESYFNSGIMLFDIKACLNENILEKAVENLAKYKNLEYPDQDILNLTLKNRFKALPSYWNYMWGQRIIFDQYELPFTGKWKIIHYTSSIKPWDMWRYPLAEVFWKYAKISPFYEQILFRNINKALSVSKCKIIFLTVLRKLILGKQRKAIKNKITTAKQTFECLRKF